MTTPTPTPDETIYYWCLTFGQRYATEPHPRFPDAHPDGWVEIAARTRWDARSLALSTFGQYWCDIYHPDDFDPSYYPLGRLARLDATEVKS